MTEETMDLQKLGFVVDVSRFTVGDMMDLADESLPLIKRLGALEHGLVQGDLRTLPLTMLPEFIEAVSAEMGKKSNPT